ncbi:MAG: efflux RND transporter periplasmic adaptor subunit [Bacteroidota bacterium]
MNMGSSSSRIRIIALGALLLIVVLVAIRVLRSPGVEEIEEPGRVEPLSLEEVDWIDIQTTPHPRVVDIQGRLRAEHRFELFPEVAGRVMDSETQFREGTRIQKGEPILTLDDREARLELYALRSAYQSLVASLLPDIKLDHPEELPTLESWLDAMDPEQRIPKVPEFDSGQLRRFLTAKGVYERYYRIRSAETRLEKFIIRAPFTGEIASARVEPGQSVGPQTHAGSFIDPNRYRLSAMVRSDEIGLLDVGDSVELSDDSGKGRWTGSISRMSPVVDPQTQSVEVQLQVYGETLREGEYLQGRVEVGQSDLLADIPVSALRRDGSVYRVREGQIEHHPVEVVRLGRDRVQVRGLSDGDRILRSVRKVLAGRRTAEVSP